MSLDNVSENLLDNKYLLNKSNDRWKYFKNYFKMGYILASVLS